jgi:hypothetical protein
MRFVPVALAEQLWYLTARFSRRHRFVEGKEATKPFSVDEAVEIVLLAGLAQR